MEALTAAKRLIDAGSADLQRFSVLHGLCAANYFAGGMTQALSLAIQIVEVANRQADTTYRIVGYRLLGTMQVLMGEPSEALRGLEDAEQYRNPTQRSISSWFGIDPGLNVLYWQTMALLLLGRRREAVNLIDQIQSELASHGNAYTVAAGNFYSIVWPDFLFGDPRRVNLIPRRSRPIAPKERLITSTEVAFCPARAYARDVNPPTRPLPPFAPRSRPTVELERTCWSRCSCLS